MKLDTGDIASSTTSQTFPFITPETNGEISTTIQSNIFPFSTLGSQKSLTNVLDKSVRPPARRVGRKPRGDHLCKYCGDVFQTEQILRIHKKHHRLQGDVPNKLLNIGPKMKDKVIGSDGEEIVVPPTKHLWKCKLCPPEQDKTYSAKVSWLRHQRAVHTLETPYVCDQCGRSFHVSGELARHKREIHEAPRHQCNICLKRFTRAHDARSHLDTHSSQPLYQCEQCGTRLKSKGCLRKHVQCRHSGEKKPLECPHCSKTFHRKNVLRAHMSVHTGQYAFPCPHCHSRFSYNTALKQHIRTQHFLNTSQKESTDTVIQMTSEPSILINETQTLDTNTSTTTILNTNLSLATHGMDEVMLSDSQLLSSTNGLIENDQRTMITANNQLYIISSLQCPKCDICFLSTEHTALKHHLVKEHGITEPTLNATATGNQ